MPNNVVELVVRLQDKLTAPLQQMNGQLEAFGATVRGLASVAGVAGLVGVVGSFAKQSFEAADALGDAADRAGVAVESLSRLKFVAEQNDVEFGALTTSIKRWQVLLSQASSGQKDAAGSLKLLGLSAEQLKGLSLETQLASIADQFKRIRDPADQTRVAVELFGRAGEQLVPLLRQGGGAIAELTAEADRLGITLDETTAKAADRTDKALKKLFATIKAGSARAAGSFAEIFFPDASEFAEAERKLEEFRRNRDELADPNWLEKLTMTEETRQKLLASFNQSIDEQLRAINAIRRRQRGGDDSSPLEIPKEPEKIAEVRITQRKAELEGLAKLLEQFERDTKLTEDKIYQDYLETTTKIKELQKAGIIDAEEAAKRTSAARIKYESDVIIDPVKITQSKVVVQQVLTQQQQAVNKFVDTLTVGLDNLAHSGELTGRSILKYLLASFESQVLKDAIAGLGNYLKGALGGTGGSGSSALGSFLNGLFGAFGHAAGGGRMSGPRIVGEDGPELDLGGGNIMNRRQMAFAMAGAGGGVQLNTTNVWNIDGSASPAATAQYVESRLQTRDRKLLEQVDRLMKNNYGRGLR